MRRCIAIVAVRANIVIFDVRKVQIPAKRCTHSEINGADIPM